MKWTLLAAAALVLCCGLPFRTHETRTLLPVQTVQAERTEAGVRIVTEAGEGSGATWDDAVAALRMDAPGEVYFDTAGQVVLCGKTDRLVNELLESGILRPAAQEHAVVGEDDAVFAPPEELHAQLFLKLHELARERGLRHM